MVGHGLVGAVVARTLVAAGMRVVLIDGGSPASGRPGGHLRNLSMCRADRGYYGDMVRSHLRPVSQPRPRSGLPGLPAGAGAMPDGNGLNSGQRARLAMPGARTTSLLGGMGTLWNCVTPRLDPLWEQWLEIPEGEWPQWYERAERLLAVGVESAESAEYAVSRQRFVLDAVPGARPAPLAGLGGSPQAGGMGTGGMLAAELSAAGLSHAGPRVAGLPNSGLPNAELPNAELSDTRRRPRWTGPGEVLDGLSPAEAERLQVLGDCVVRRLRHRAGRVVAADAVDLVGGAPLRIEADYFVVAAGPLRTPALLWASGLAGAGAKDSPLGRCLNDHPLSYAQVVLAGPDLPPSADPGKSPDPDPAVIVPLAPDRPFHALLVTDRYDAALLEGRVDERLILSLYWYARSEPQWENRVRFDGLPTDAMGLPQPTFEYELCDVERERQAAALEDLRTTAGLLGRVLPSSPPQNVSPGGSMHLMGTTRTGPREDGRSVVDGFGRVWGTENLFLGGTSVIPGGTATNPTLAACAAAVRTATHIIEP